MIPARRPGTRDQIGACHYCARVEHMTLDHTVPKPLRGAGWRVRTVLACQPCNKRKAASDYEDFIAWLCTDEGYEYLRLRHLDGRPVGCPIVREGPRAGGVERHRCWTKPCGVLRAAVLVLGDGTSAWARLAP